MFNLFIMSFMHNYLSFRAYDINIQFIVWVKVFNKAIFDLENRVDSAEVKEQVEWSKEQVHIVITDNSECEEDGGVGDG